MKVERGATIAVVGASARAAAFSLLRAGYPVVTADLFADADLARRCHATRIASYPEGFDDWLTETKCDAWLYTGALENYPTLVDRLAASQTLLGHRGAGLRRVRDPLQLQAVLTRAGLQFPHTETANQTPKGDRWLGKTYRGSCGSGVCVNSGTAFVQQRIEGVPLSAVYIGSRLIGVTRQFVGEPWTGASEFQYCGTIAPWPVPSETLPQLVRLGTVLHDEFELTDLYGVDLILDGGTLWTIEINPRYTAAAEVVERALEINVFANQSQQASTAPGAKGALKHDVDPCGKVIVYAKAPLVITAATSQSLLQHAGDLPWPTIADIPAAGTQILVGQPILTLFAAGESCENVQLQLQQRVADVERGIYGKARLCD
ncbi:MAG: ATP-grasp domain-containing protein [Bythopirellula sp.]